MPEINGNPPSERRAVREALGLSRLGRAPGCEGIQVLGGRMAKTFTFSGSGNSFEFSAELMAKNVKSVGSIRAIAGAANGNGNARCTVFLSGKMLGAFADADSAYATNFTFTGGGQIATSFMPNSGLQRRHYVFSDPMIVTPVPRTDGGVRPIASARAWCGSAQTYALLGNDAGTDVYTNWPSRAAGAAQFRAHATVGDQRLTTTGWAASSVGLVDGFAFSHATPVVNVFTIGDSISEGRGTYVGASFGLRACEMINAEGHAIQMVHSNFAWSGCTTANWLQHLSDILRDGLVPDILVFPIFSPNDTGNANITDAQIDAERSRVMQILALCAQYSITPLAWTGIPCDASVNNWGASDAKRVAYNAEMLTLLRAAGHVVCDLETVFNGVVDGNGQMQIKTAYTTDHIHPNDTGIEAGANAMVSDLKAIIGGYLDAAY